MRSERFAREARAMATLSSKHTVRVYDVGALPSGLPFMVMELLIGRDLHRELQDRGPLPLSEACDFIDQACQAVAEAHGAGIIHRDLKPQNLFLTMVKGRPLIRVLDFGIARSIGAAVKLETITRLGDVIGTLHYMSPEQIRNSKSVEPRSDVWSLGACLYKLITGWPPFPQAGEAPLMSAILTSPPKPIADYRKDVPPILTSVIMRCLRKAPEERFPNATELRKALEEVALFLTLDDYGEKTELMASTGTSTTRDAEGRLGVRLGSAGDHAHLEAPVDSRNSGFNKTLPLDAATAQTPAGRSSARRSGAHRDSSLRSRGRPHNRYRRRGLAADRVRAALAADAVGADLRSRACRSRLSRPPTPIPRSRSLQATVPARRPAAQSSLSFLMIVLAVAVGVFIAGIALFVVLSRHRWGYLPALRL